MIRLSAFRSAHHRTPLPFEWSLEYLATKLTTFKVRPEVPERIERERAAVRAGQVDGWLAEQVERHGVDHVVNKVIPSRAKSTLPAWSPAVYPSGATRAAANVEVVSCIVLDVDDGTPVERVWSLWAEHPRILHTSWSHSAAKAKCRLVVPLAEPIPQTAWKRVWTWTSLQASRRGVTPDKQCSDPSRLFFAPAVPSEASPREARTHLEGELLRIEWQGIPDPDEAARAARCARAALVLPPGTRVPDRVRLGDVEVREGIAARLGAKVEGSGADRRAENIPCPGCGRSSVFFYVEPTRMQSARCDHRNSCGWWGAISELESSCSTC